MEVVPSDKPPDIFAVRSITMDVREVMTEWERFGEVMTREELEKEVAAVRTMYKRKDRKVRPVNAPLPGGINPGGGANIGGELQEGETEDLEPWKRGGGTVVPRGSRLTPERLKEMQIGTGLLWEGEKQLFIDILFEHEGAIAFDDSEMGLLKPEIELPVVIHTVPYTPWQ